MTRGPGAETANDGDTITPAGFGWVVDQLGGVRVVSGDIDALEAVMDQTLESVHDALWHRPDGDYNPPADEFCTNCLRPDHGGRVDPAADPFLARQVRPEWVETTDGWSRVRPSLTAALAVLEEEANEK